MPFALHRSLILCVALASLSPAPASAQEATEAQLLYERGAELYRARRFGEALEAMVASNRLVPNANVVFNVAQIYELLERPIDAFNWYQRHLGFDLDPESRARADARLEILRTQVAVLDVQTTPEGAALYIDRVELGTVGPAPRKVAVAAGAHTVIARLDGYRDAQAATAAVVGQAASVELSLTRMMGTLEMRSEPPGAQVFLDGDSEPLGSTPLTLERPVGLSRLSVRLDGHLSRELDVRIVEATAASYTVTLSPDPSRFAALTIEAVPAGATVTLDGEPQGQTPLTLRTLPPGIRSLRVERPAHEPWAADLQLIAGSTTRVEASLVANADKPWPHWHWLGYGAAGLLLAVGAGIGIAALDENRDDDPDPDRVDDLNTAADSFMLAGVALAATTLVLHLNADPPPRSHGRVATDR